MDVIKFGFSYYKKQLGIAIFCLVIFQVLSLCGLLFPALNGMIIDHVLLPAGGKSAPAAESVKYYGFIFNFAKNGLNLFWAICVVYFIQMLIRFVLQWLHNFLLQYNGIVTEGRLRRDALNKYLSQSKIVTNRYNTGEMMTLQGSDVIQYKNMYCNVFPAIINFTLVIICCFFFLFMISPWLLLVAAIILPFFTVISLRYVNVSKALWKNIRNCTADLSMAVQENINAVRIIRSFASEEQEQAKFNVKNENMRQAYNSLINFNAKYNAIFGAVSFMGYLASLVIAVVLAVNAQITIGDFVAYYVYISVMQNSITLIVNQLFTVQQQFISATRVYIFLNTGNIIESPADPLYIKDSPDISFKNATVQFDNQMLLSNIDLEIPFGKSLGIMGFTSGGKTVLLKTLNRFYEVTDGSLTINGHDIKALDLENIRGQFSFVPQDVLLFSDTVENNIAFYQKTYEQDELVLCAELACAKDFIDNMPEKYKTIIGERGIGLSGGQKQRISIARALFKNAPVLILDDATSALDTGTEKKLLENIKSHYAGRTVIITAHRASSVRHCDEIIFLEHGKITERGTHEQLMELKGNYHKIFVSQAAEQITNDKL